MQNTSDDLSGLLISFLRRFVAIVKDNRTATWDALKTAVTGKTAYFRIDRCRLRVRAPSRGPGTLRFARAGPREAMNFAASSDTLRRIIEGSATLDGAIAGGKIFVRGTLPDLLRMHLLVMNVLADGATCRELRLLWHEFDAAWPKAAAPASPVPLADQVPCFGEYIHAIPSSLLKT